MDRDIGMELLERSGEQCGTAENIGADHKVRRGDVVSF